MPYYTVHNRLVKSILENLFGRVAVLKRVKKASLISEHFLCLSAKSASPVAESKNALLISQDFLVESARVGATAAGCYRSGL
jgi:hypothetical protein